MIKFRKKSLVQNLMPEAVNRLNEQGVRYNKISLKDADKVSSVNSKAMVLVSFVKNEQGYFQIQFQSKQIYGYVKKLIGEIFRMRITDIDTPRRIITAETDHLGIALDIIEVLGLDPHFNLSLVIDNDKI